MVETVHAKERRRNVMGFDPFEAPFGKGGDHQAHKTESRTINLQGISARVDRVTVEGLGRTKDDVVNYAVKDLFNAENFEDIITLSHKVRLKLQSLGCFRNIAIHIDTSQGHGSTPNGYEVVYEVKEMKRINGGVTTNVANNTGILTIGGFAPNLFGRGESLRGEMSFGSNKSQNNNITFVKPIMSRRNLIFSASLFQGQNSFPKGGMMLTEIGGIGELGFCLIPSWPQVKQKIQLEGSWRILGVGNKSSFFVRTKAGNDLKTCIRHILSIDSRDSTVLPTVGNLLQLKTEAAGLLGNVKFFKNELKLQTNFGILENFSLQLGLNAGVLMNSDDPKPVDNFFLGGPLTFRGFNSNGVGPKEGEDFVGANVYWAAAAHLYTPLPFRPAAGGFGELFRFHAFVNCGNITNCKMGGEGGDGLIKCLTESVRVAVGLGFVLRLGGMARVELNGCFPVSAQDSDDKVAGLQFGIGVDFL